jgi:hypothetical protein
LSQEWEKKEWGYKSTEVKAKKKWAEHHVSLKAQIYEQYQHSSKQINITGNESGSRKGIPLRVEEIQSREIILKGNITKKKKIVPLKVSTNIRKV